MHPYLNIFGLKIPSYGLLMAVAIITALLISYYRAKKAGFNSDLFSNMAIIAILSGIIGAYLLYLFVTYPISEIIESIRNGSFSVFKQSGLVFYGAVIGGFLGAFIYLKAKKERFLDYAAVIVPTIPLAHAIGRVGCFMAGCCYGRCIDTPISVIYKNPIGGAPVGVPVFPIQLVESACLLIIFAILLIYTAKNLKRKSALFLYMLLYGIERFILEYFRHDEVRGIFLGLSTSQWISILMVVGGLLGFILLHRYERRHPEEKKNAEEPAKEDAKAEEAEAACDDPKESEVDNTESDSAVSDEKAADDSSDNQ